MHPEKQKASACVRSRHILSLSRLVRRGDSKSHFGIFLFVLASCCPLGSGDHHNLCLISMFAGHGHKSALTPATSF